MKNKIFSNITQVIFLVTLFGLPLFFAPFFTDAYDFGKQIFLLVFTFLLFILWLGKSIVEKKLVYKTSPYFGILGLVIISFLLSTLINSPNKILSFSTPLGIVSLLLGLFFFVLIRNLSQAKQSYFTLIGSGVVLSLITLIIFLVSSQSGAAINLPFSDLRVANGFSPAGSLISQAIFLLILIPLSFSLIYEEIKKGKLVPAAVLFSANVVLMAGLGVSVYLLTSSVKMILLPQGTAWAIAMESLKNGRFAIFGLGPGQFLNAFTQFKPLSFNNNSNLWNLRFASSSNWYYQLLTEVGLLGLFLYLLLTWRILKNSLLTFRQPKLNYSKLAIYFSLLLFLVIQFFLPLNFFLIVLLFVLLALSEEEPKEEKVFDLTPLANASFVILIAPIFFYGLLSYFATRLSLASYYYLNSLKAANRNDGVSTYNMQIKALNLDQRSVLYHIGYSQTNFALANSLATKEDLTDQDRSTISQLIQQAIREAKAAVALDPLNAGAWENLAGLYRNLINFAQGADQWAVAAYQQAINLDPLNPRIRIDLGGLFYSVRNFDQALNLFSQAANLKQDYANAHYNLANALREKGDLQNAKREYEVTQSLVPIDTNDYQKVTAELEEVKRRLAPSPTPTAKPGKPETLSTPQPPAEGIKPPLELPNEGPPISPTPAP